MPRLVAAGDQACSYPDLSAEAIVACRVKSVWCESSKESVFPAETLEVSTPRDSELTELVSRATIAS